LRILIPFAIAALATAQVIDPSELRVRSEAYVPRTGVTLKVDTNLVEVGVVVRDSRGRTVGGLNQADFELFDQGKKRDITAFSVQTSLRQETRNVTAPAVSLPGPPAQAPPRIRYVALLFDDLTMDLGHLRPAQIAAKRFVQEGLGPGDRVSLFTTSSSQNLPFTSDPATLVAAIDNLRIRQRVAFSGICPRITPYDAYLIANNMDPATLTVKIEEAMRCAGERPPPRRGRGGSGGGSSKYEDMVRAQAGASWEETRMRSLATLATIENIVAALAPLDGGRMILLVSSGFYSRTLEYEQDRLTNRALRAGVVINTLDAKGLYTASFAEMPPGGDMQSMIREQSLGVRPQETANDSLYFLADSTGGLFFHNNNDLQLGFTQLGVAPEVSYLLAFAPDAVSDGKFHRLRVRLTNGRGRFVQFRPGYMPVRPEDKETTLKERRIDKEILGAGKSEEVPIQVSTDPPAAGDTGLNAVLHLDLKLMRMESKLDPIQLRDVRAQTLTFIAAVFDERGNFVTGREAELDFALSQATYDRLAEKGLAVPAALKVPAGKYRLRVAVHESLGGRMTVIEGPVEVK
jgi:VWFA-related protein